jgi:hypothetical protein
MRIRNPCDWDGLPPYYIHSWHFENRILDIKTEKMEGDRHEDGVS